MNGVTRTQLSQVFTHLREGQLQGVAAEPQTQTRFNSKNARVERNQHRWVDVKSRWGKILRYTVTGLGYATLTLPIYRAIKGKYTRYVQPAMDDGDRNAAFISQVTKSQWKSLSRFSKGSKEEHLEPSTDRILRSSAMKIINVRADAQELRAVLQQCTTRQLCQLARGIGKEELVQVPAEAPANGADPGAEAGAGKAKAIAKLSWSPAVFDRLKAIQRDMKSPLLDQPVLETFATFAAQRDDAAEKVQFEKPAPAEPVDAPAQLQAPGPAAAGAPDIAGPLRPQELKSLRALGAELLLPANLARAVPLLQSGEPGRAALQQVLLEHQEAVALLCARPDTGADAQLPAGLGQALRQALALPDALSTDPPPTSEQWQDHLAKVQTAIESLDSGQAQALGQALNGVVDEFDFSSFSSQLQAIETGLRGPMNDFFNEVFTGYFSGQLQEDKRSMVASLLRQSLPTDSPNDRLVAVLKGAGPFMHKVLQLFCDKVEDEGTKTALSSVKTGLAPMDRELKTAMLAKIVRDSKGAIEAMSEVRTLGAASVGEALLATVKMPAAAGQEAQTKSVVIKLLRPGIVERAQRERAFFAEAASHYPGVGQTFAGMAEQIEAEMNLQTEAEHVAQGQVYSVKGQAVQVEAMKLSSLVQAQNDYMVVERAEGSALQQCIEVCEKAARGENDMPPSDALAYGNRAAEKLLKLGEIWMSEAVAGNGFFHGDLHAGNLMFDEKSSLLTVIDFGNAAAIDRQQRQILIRLGMALQQGHPRLFEKEFRRLLGPAAETRVWENKSVAVNAIKKVMRNGTLDMAEKLAKILEAYTSKGIEVPAVISNFSRSMMMLRETLDRLNAANRINALRADPQHAEQFRQRDELHGQLRLDLPEAAKERLNKQISMIDETLSDFGPEPQSMGDAFAQAIRPHALKLGWRAGLGFAARVAQPGVEELDAKGVRIEKLEAKIAKLETKMDFFGSNFYLEEKALLEKELAALRAQDQSPVSTVQYADGLKASAGQAKALSERMVPLRQPGADLGARRTLISDLIGLRRALTESHANLTDKLTRQSATTLRLSVEKDIEELFELQRKDLDEAMDKATLEPVARQGSALKVLQTLETVQQEVGLLKGFRGQTDYAIQAQPQIQALASKAERLEREFKSLQSGRRLSPQSALTRAGAPSQLMDAQDIAQSQTQLAGLSQARRQGLLQSHAQAPGAAQARWGEQTKAIEAMAQRVLAQIEVKHNESLAELTRVWNELRPDMVGDKEMEGLDAAKDVLVKSLNADRDRLRAEVQALTQERLGSPQPALTAHLAGARWAEAAPLLLAQNPSPGDLAQLALALKLHTQPDQLARFMHAIVPSEVGSRTEFLTQVLPRDAQASAPSGPYMTCMASLEQLDEGASSPLVGALIRAVGQHNPGTSTLAGGADGQIVRLDDPKNIQSVGSARQAMITVASPNVALKGADLSQSVLHIEYRKEHISAGQPMLAWIPSLEGARLDGARIVLDLSDLPTRVLRKTQRIEFDGLRPAQLVPLFGFEESMEAWEMDVTEDYRRAHPDFDSESDDFPEAVLKTISAGPPARPGLHSILSSISTDYPQQRKDVACQLLDLALQVPADSMASERLFERSPLFSGIRKDQTLMADPDVARRMRELKAKQDAATSSA